MSSSPVTAPPADDTAVAAPTADTATGDAATPVDAVPAEEVPAAAEAVSTDATGETAPAADAAPSPSELVHLDRIGSVGGGTSTAGRIRILGLGIPESARQRIAKAGGLELVDDRSQLHAADLVVVSTRTPRGELTTLLASLEDSPAPIVALAHTGGEGLAVDVVRAGGRGVVAEGNEAALLGYATGEAYDTSLVETYDRQVARSRSGEDSAASHDPVTDLPGASTFSRRLAELGQVGDVPRIGFLRLLHVDRGGRSLSPQGLSLLRRRLALQFRRLAAEADVELFSMNDTEFALLSPRLSPNQAEQLGYRMARVTETFAPAGSRPLALAVGHAGPEVSGELSTLRELAHRAMVVAAAREISGVVGADALALGAAPTIELEAAQRILESVEAQSALPAGHGKRTGQYAAAVAFELGYDGPECARIRLAAHLHEIGMAGLGADALAPPEELEGAAGAARRAAPARGAAYVRTSAGDEVADAIWACEERWDGRGHPRGLAEEQIPIAARIIAVACRFDALVSSADADPARAVEDALAALAEEAGGRLDPGLVSLAAPVLARVAEDA
ncbi:MAG TPA: HD domain-containing phosphohydrolase [Egibacteraceae bacterium]